MSYAVPAVESSNDYTEILVLSQANAVRASLTTYPPSLYFKFFLTKNNLALAQTYI